MRDPRESQWAFAASVCGDIPESDELFWEIQARLSHLQGTVRVLSLTEDDRRIRERVDQRFGRGFAHPRLWEHYADDHRGVCLVFDREALVASAERMADPLGELHQRPVAYRDGQIAVAASGVDLNDMADSGADTVLLEHFDRHVNELFFTKLEDWETENEYRFVIRWDSADEFAR